jgi:hypothetical protein
MFHLSHHNWWLSRVNNGGGSCEKTSRGTARSWRSRAIVMNSGDEDFVERDGRRQTCRAPRDASRLPRRIPCERHATSGKRLGFRDLLSRRFYPRGPSCGRVEGRGVRNRRLGRVESSTEIGIMKSRFQALKIKPATTTDEPFLCEVLACRFELARSRAKRSLSKLSVSSTCAPRHLGQPVNTLVERSSRTRHNSLRLDTAPSAPSRW